jgi:N-acyl-D-amino-acid deacylase
LKNRRKNWKKSPVEAALEIIRSRGDASVASFNMQEADIENFMRQDFVVTGSDGSAGHPRKYGTFARKLREYVYTKKLITLPFAIQHSSSMTAETLRIPQRGLLRQGYYADVIVFDEKTVADRATYERSTGTGGRNALRDRQRQDCGRRGPIHGPAGRPRSEKR